MQNKTLLLLLLISLISTACSTNTNYSTQDTLPKIPPTATTLEASNHFTAMCQGFSKSGAEQGYGDEVELFIYCLDEVIKAVEVKQKEQLSTL